jgi:SET domain-containing protein
MSPSRVLKSARPLRFSLYRLRIGRSRIHRLGVFATRPIPEGRKVLEYTGERLNARQVLPRFRKIWRPGGSRRDYIFRLNRRCWLDGSVGGSGAERINHSCDPNLVSRLIRGHILLFSRRRIRAGEELTLDYRLHPKGPKVVCRCGSPKCRGTINRKHL